MPTSSSSDVSGVALADHPETPDVAGAYPRLDDAQIMYLRRFGEERTVPAGETLFCAGDRDCDFFVVLSGTVAVVQESDSEPQLVAVHGPGRFLGDMSLLEGQAMYLTAIAREEVRVLAVPVDRLGNALSADPALGDLILRAFLVRRSLHSGIGAGMRIIGSRYSADCRRIREFVSRNRVPHRWIDLEEDREAEAILERFQVSPEDTPIVIWKGKQVLRNPSNAELASLIGLRAAPDRGAYDLLVVGAGPAGLAAAVYGASEGLDTLVLDSVATGGQAATSSQIENYLGFPAGISGAELADRAVVQARKFGSSFTIPGEASGLDLDDGYHVVRLTDGETLTSHALILACGATYRRLEVPGIDRLESTSVYYAATEAEAQMCRGDPVTVVGGGNSAGQASLFLVRRSPQVNLVVRHGDLGRDMSRYLADRITATPEIRVWLNSEVTALKGEKVLEEVVVRDGNGEEHHLPSTAVFVLIGSEPHTDWLDGQLELDEDGFVLTGTAPGCSTLETDRPGVFAAGDVRSGSIKRVASAVGEGSMAVRLVHQYLEVAGRR